MPVLAPGAVTATTANVTLTAPPADGTLDVQYSPRADFLLAVSPLVRGVAVGDFVLSGLNSGSTYYVRARARRASGDVEDWSNIVAVRTSAGAARVLTPAAIMIEPAMLVVPAPVLSWADGGNGVAGYPADNLGHDGPTAWVSKGAAPHTFIAETGANPVDTIALLMSNAAPDAVVTVKAGATASGAGYSHGPVSFRASAALPQRPGFHALIRLPAPQTHRYWRIEITSANFENQFHLEHAVFGLNRVTKNHSVDKAETPIDLGTLNRTRSGNPIRAVGARMRRVDFDLSVMTEAQFEANYSDLWHLVGATEPVLCVPNAKANAFLHDRILYGPLSGGKIVNVASPVYTRGFTLESIV